MDDNRTAYSEFIKEQNIEGSNKASSYIRALELLDIILKRSSSVYHNDNFWSIRSINKISRLYEYALKNQKKEGSEFLASGTQLSYGRNGYYSAALKSYKAFLILQEHETRLWTICENSQLSPDEMSKALLNKKLESIEELVPDKDIDFSSQAGKEVLREVKTRVNQGFFRKMILSYYSDKCCITGLDIPKLLIASHIKPWSQDEGNRLNPCNGLCLNSLHDKAFDIGLITIDSDQKIVISKQVKDHYSRSSVKKYFEEYEGTMISSPTQFLPDEKFLEYHRNKIFQG